MSGGGLDLVYARDGVTLFCGDCRPDLGALGPVDLVLTDPPYDDFTHRGAMTGAALDSFGVDFGALGDPADLARHLIEVSAGWALIFCSLEMLGRYQAAAPDFYVRGGIWDRIVNSPQISGDRPAQGGEGIAIFHHTRKSMRWNGGGKAGIWRRSVERGKKVHPTQKPIALIRDLVLQFSNPGDLVLDPFCGSGTTLAACKELGRRAIGVEVNPGYCEIAVDRLDHTTGALPGVF